MQVPVQVPVQVAAREAEGEQHAVAAAAASDNGAEYHDALVWPPPKNVGHAGSHKDSARPKPVPKNSDSAAIQPRGLRQDPEPAGHGPDEDLPPPPPPPPQQQQQQHGPTFAPNDASHIARV